MKKLLYFVAFVATMVLSSCQKDEIGGTATESAAGEWVVTADGVDSDGNVLYEDVYGQGSFNIYTYNTAANVSNEMYVDDQKNFWGFKTKIACEAYECKNLGATFGSATAVVDEYNGINVTITDGKVTKNGTVTPSGTKADEISFYVVFSDDSYVGKYYDKLWIHGYRRTGLQGGAE